MYLCSLVFITLCIYLDFSMLTRFVTCGVKPETKKKHLILSLISLEQKYFLHEHEQYVMQLML